MIRTHQLTKRFGAVTAVDAVDIVVEDPGIVGFLGPNGAGKTTTMRMLTGFLPMSDGTAIVAGYDVFDQPGRVKANVGYLPESPPLYPELTVGEYLSFVAEIRGVPRRRRLARIGEVMARVGLTGWEQHLTGALSKGYRQRVGLAQALVHDPPLLILDEPTSGLDPAQLVGIRALIRELANDRTVVLSTHVLPEVEQLCDRVILIGEGRIVGDGTVEALAAQVGTESWVGLQVDGAPDDISAILAAVPAVRTVRRLSATHYRLTGNCVDAVADVVRQRGWRLRGLSPHAASLQDVFMALVGEET
jgi:ABC-2 type transport system ATP-binding protein